MKWQLRREKSKVEKVRKWREVEERIRTGWREWIEVEERIKAR